ncbi:GtrA family protein [Mesorhizobium sp. BR1-1-16]|uniref:GtrA family protein n=1 Tax=Mesorhizobium sp. BR1-1-16 TaxID=2876653 RepID=UPI001CCD7078|nr:GtrA family protein [Mesorhizobium sp. BR1-1-16]MBZ9937585.1 GtrA family protein [Mesorhizobium sp. BR1-1-16]
MIRRALADPRIRHLVHFAIAGFTAFAVDAAMLQLLLHFGLGPLVARPFAILTAMIVGWLINRTWTFPMPGRPHLREFARYAAVASISSVINYGIYAAIILARPQTLPFLALVIATAISTVASYSGYRFFTFRHRPKAHPAAPSDSP